MRWLPICVALLSIACQEDVRPRQVAEVDLGGREVDLGGYVVVEGPDAGSPDASFDPDAACASVEEVAKVEYLPLDIIWVVDNSSSMASSIAEVRDGINAFANLIGASNLDYHIILLSLRGAMSPVQLNGSTRYPICVPPPLAGGAACENGPRFLHSSVDIKSTQTLEQVLGTLGQTTGFTPGTSRGGEPWRDFLRDGSSKTFVVVTDDNARLSKTQFESFAGGQDPYNSTTLPPGILDPSWNGLFTGYQFSGIYGWESPTDPSESCQFADGTAPASAGPTYSSLVLGTSGVRARICDGASAWSGFFSQVATAVQKNAKLTCNLAIPTPSGGPQTVDPAAINVSLVPGTGAPTQLYKVSDASDCSAAGGWYYDDPATPTHVLLCPASCDKAQTAIGGGAGGQIRVAFGCATLVL